jgi:hypothetical protein
MHFVRVTVTVAMLIGTSLPAEEPAPVELTLHPRAIETPVLKYRLFPAEAERQRGNAAPILLRLPWDQVPWMTNVYPNLEQWGDLPLDAPEWQSWHGDFGAVFPDRFYSEMKRAAFREDASWEYPIHETPSPYMVLLPDVQGMRGFLGRGLSARIRYHLSRGELDAAREGILVGFANSRHLAQTPFLITQLVALALHRIMLDRTMELISQPDSPNLYWALSTLPDSLIELERAASLEGSLFAMTFPAVNELDRPRDPEVWSRMARQLVDVLQQLGEIPRQEPPREDAPVVQQFLERLQPPERDHLAGVVRQARADLPELLGIPADKVAAMSDDEAAVRWYVHLRLDRDQRTAAVLVLAPREAWPRLKELQDDIREMQDKTGTKSYDFLNPVSIYVSAWSLERRIDALRIVEAVRHHLARHEGRFPETLEQVEGVSIPVDPLTNQPFEWSVDDNTATLKAPALPADVVEAGSAVARGAALVYRLKVKSPAGPADDR